MPNYVTENNKPNRKLIMGAITGFVVAVAPFVFSRFGVEIPQDVLSANVEMLVGGISAIVTAIITIAGYISQPGKNDGVKEKE